MSGHFQGHTGLGGEGPGAVPPIGGGDPEQTVLLQIPAGDGEALGEFKNLDELEHDLRKALRGADAGRVEEVAKGEPTVVIRLVGKDAHAMFRLVGPVVNNRVPAGSVAVVRAEPGSEEERIELSPPGG